MLDVLQCTDGVFAIFALLAWLGKRREEERERERRVAAEGGNKDAVVRNEA